MIEGYIPVPIEHFGGLVACWPSEMLDVSLATEATNVRFTPSGVMNREGLTKAFVLPTGAPISGMVNYDQPGDVFAPIVFGWDGEVWREVPSGSGFLTKINPSSTTIPPASAYLNGTNAYDRAYLAFSDGRMGVGSPMLYDGGNLLPVTIPAPTGSSNVADSAAAGNIAAGLRYGIVMYETVDGTITAPQGPFSWDAAGGKQVTVSNLPVGPAEVVARIVAFTVAGGSSAGPYFYIGSPQTVNGVSETSTVVEDNITRSATFNFDDSFLASSVDATSYFRAITLPNETGVLFAKSVKRLIWWGELAQPSLLRISEADQPGVYFGDTGFALVSEADGQRVTACFEWRDQIYAGKEDGLHLVTPNDGDPANWSVQPIAQRSGPCSDRALDVADDFVFYVHRSGGYIFDGGAPQCVTDELRGPSHDHPGPWERINWAYAHLIWVAIDTEEKVVRIGVPLDASTSCSHILKVSYLDGWDKSVEYSRFSMRFHYVPGRRWSIDCIAASQGMRVKRVSTVGLQQDRRQAVSQFLLASSAGDGYVNLVDPSASLDNGNEVKSVYRTGSISVSEVIKQQRQGMQVVGIVQVRARGNCRLTVDSIIDGGEPQPFLITELAPTVNGDFRAPALAEGENVAMRFRGDGTGPWMLMAAYAFAKPTWVLRF